MNDDERPSVVALVLWFLVLLFCVIGLVSLMFYAVSPAVNSQGE
jgi:hypothetical protein